VGARKSDVLWLVLRQGLKLALLGIGIGLFAAFFLSPLWLTDQLHDLDPLDPVTFATAVLFVVVLVLLATFLPTRKATASDPMTCLREE
jgi:ABC-type lipoprotein release transport system permease subunit